MSTLTTFLASLDLTSGEVILLLAAALAAGVVRGFSGFGTALVFMPLASSVMTPHHAMIVLLTMDFWGPLPQLPKALREGDLRDSGLLLLGAALFLPLGVLLLTRLPIEPLRYMVSLGALLTLAALMSGYRYQGQLGARGVFSLGALGGGIGGAIGLAGPPVILFYMVRPLAAKVIRANLILYFAGIVVLTFANLAVQGQLVWGVILLGLGVAPFYLGAVSLGARLFKRQGEGAYRPVAYAVIGLSGVIGLPIW